MRRLRPFVLGLLAAAVPAQSEVTTPEEFLGHEVGADHFLANYTQLSAYWRKLAGESDRMVLEEIGTTSYGQTMLVAVVSSPANLARIEQLRATSETLCRAKGLTEAQAASLARDGRAVIWIDAGMHATESVAAQNILELVYRMTSQNDAETRRILDNVILLVCPANPDGMEMIANAYMATKRVGSIPVLYQRYIGHDNNRDFYMSSMPETEAINRMLYRRWFPQIVYNHHQSAPRGTIIFTPPFRDPFNYNVDPLVIRGIELVAAHMNARFAWEGKPGVISRSGASYSTWWNGGLRTTTYFHNMIGILTESFGSPNPTKITQTHSRRLPYGDYPMPVSTQEWHARQTIEYLQTANFAILDLASRYREELLMNMYRMGRNAIQRGSQDSWTPTPRLLAEAKNREEAEATDAGAETASGEAQEAAVGVVDAFTDAALRDPRAYVLPADQRDFAAATRFANVLLDAGVEVHRTTKPFEAHGRDYPEGSWVVFTAQAFRAHVRDMFEPQWHPDDVDASGNPIRPYDSAGWTPAMSMGIEFDRFLDPLSAPTEPVAEAILPSGEVAAGSAGFLLHPHDSNGFVAINRLLAAGETLSSLESPWGDHPAGTTFVANGSATEARLRTLAGELGLDFIGVDTQPDVARRDLRAPRIGLFDVYGGNMATGWTRWTLQQFEFPVVDVFGKRIHEGSLGDDFDVLVFHTGLPSPPDDPQRVQRALRRGRPNPITDEEIEKMVAALPPFEDWSNVADRRVKLEVDEAIPALREFVESGGVLIAFGSQASDAIEHFDLPVRVGTWTTDEESGEGRRTRRSEFYIATSLLRGQIDTEHPLGRGSADEVALVYRRNPVFELEEGAEGVEVVARYADDDLLMSGWALGEEFVEGKAAVLHARVGEGSVCLFGADVIYRGQPQASFPMLFRALLQ